MIKVSRMAAATALTVSAGLHFLGLSASWSGEVAKIEGNASGNIAQLGNSFRDVVNGSIADVEPLETEPTEAGEPVRSVNARHELEFTRSAEPLGATKLAKAETSRMADPLLLQTIGVPTVPKQTSVEPKVRMESLPQAETVELPRELEVIQKAKPTLAESIPTVAASVSIQSKPIEMAAQAPILVHSQSPQTQTLTALANPEETTPALSARPKVRPKTLDVPMQSKATKNKLSVPAIPKPKKPKEPSNKPPRQTKDGNGQTDEKRGFAEGQKQAKSRSASKNKVSKIPRTGNASASNYAGLVMRKIQRRKPNTNIKGTAVVTFSITSSGGLGSLSLSQSSGSPKLDKLALSAVRRAAPFPKPPAGAQTRFNLGVKGR